MFDFLNSRAYTVADLKSIADRMNLSIKGKITKPVLAGIIADAIDVAHGDALVINADDLQRLMDDFVEVNTQDIASIANDFLPPLNVVPEFADAYTREAYVTVPELLAITGWSRLPRKYKKSMRKAGHLA